MWLIELQILILKGNNKIEWCDTMEENNNQEVQNEENIINEAEGIKISNDVVAVIAGVAVSEVPGVYGMSGGFAGGISEVLSGKKNLSKGIKVEVIEKEAKISELRNIAKKLYINKITLELLQKAKNNSLHASKIRQK